MRNKRLFAAFLSAMLAVSSVFPMGTASTVFAAEAAEIMETEETDTVAEEETAAQASADDEEMGEEESALIEEETDNEEEADDALDEEEADTGVAEDEADSVEEEADTVEEEADLTGEESLEEEAEAEAIEGATEEVAAPEEEADPIVIEEEVPAEETFNPALLEDIPEIIEEEKNYTSDTMLPSSDELFAGFVNIEFGMPGENKLRKSSIGSTLTGQNKAMYDIINGALPQIAEGTRPSTIFEITMNDLGIGSNSEGWTAQDLGLDTLFEGNSISQAAKEAAYAKLNLNVKLVIDALQADNPYLLYWYEKTEGWNYTLIRSIGYTTNQIGEYVLYLNGHFTIRFAVSDDYATTNEYEVDTSIGETVRRSAANAMSIVENFSGNSDYKILRGYMETICAEVDYNDAAAGNNSTPYGNPWQMIWVFDGDPNTKVVCEGYSKAFQYLCDKSDFSGDISCYSVTGYMNGEESGGRHMWNIVTMEDSLNYLVDVTNCDEGTIGEPDLLFLAGTEGGVEEGYCFYPYGEWVYYTYDEDVINLFTDRVLKLSTTNYEEPEFIIIEDGDVSLSETEFTYDGTGKQPEVTVVHGGNVLAEGTDFTVEYSQNINAGEAVAIVRGIGEYSGTVNKPFTISKAERKMLIDPGDLTTDPWNITEVAVIGLEMPPSIIQVSSDRPEVADASMYSDVEPITHYNGGAGNSGLPYVLATITPKSVGNTLITFSVEETQNYLADEVNLLVTVNKGDLTNERCDVTISPRSFEYTGEPCEPTVNIIYNRHQLSSDGDYRLVYSDNVEPGEGYVTITGCGSFAGEVTVPFEIKRIKIVNNPNVVFRSDPDYDYVYNGQAKTPEIYMFYKGVQQEKGVDYEYTIDNNNNVNAGSVDVWITGLGRFTGTRTMHFTIQKAQQQLRVDPAELTVDPLNYTQVAVIGAINNQLTASSSNREIVDVSLNTNIQPVSHYHGDAQNSGEPYRLVTIMPRKAGTAQIEFTAPGTINYEAASITLPVTVVEGDLTQEWCNVWLGEAEYTYSGDPCKPVAFVRYRDQNLTEGVDYEVNYESNVNAGTGVAIITGKGSFTGERVLEFTIRKAPQHLTADPEELTLDPWNTTEVSVSGEHTLISVTSDRPDVATASMETDILPVTPYSGDVTDGVLATVFPQSIGNALIKFTAEGDENHEEGSVSLLVTVVKGDLSRDRCEVTVTPTSFEYTGQAWYPSVSATYNGHPLRLSMDYNIGYENVVGPGEAYVVISGIGSFTGVKRIPYMINDREEQEISCDTSTSAVVNNKTIEYTVLGAKGALTCEVADPSVATATVSGNKIKVKGLKKGVTKLIVRAAETDEYYAAEAEFNLKVITLGKIKRADIFNLANTVKVTWDAVPGAVWYKVYRADKTEPVIVTKSLIGWADATDMVPGKKYTFKVVASTTGKDKNGNIVSGGESPQTYSRVMYRLKTVAWKYINNSAPGKVTVSYKKAEAGDSYVLLFADNKDMIGASSRVVKGINTTSVVLGGFNKGKTYYFQIRVRKTVNGVLYYTPFGVQKKVVITQ